MRGGAARAWRLHRRGTSARDRTRHGSVCSDSAERFHDEASETKNKALFGQRERTVKSLYQSVNPLREWRRTRCAVHTAVSNITLTRRRNALALFQEYAERELSGGAPPKGLEQSFAAKLQVSPSMWSQIKSSRPIGDKLARQIEAHCAKPEGWLDQDRDPAVLSEAEKAFLDLALRAWRSTNANGRRELRARLQAALRPA